MKQTTLEELYYGNINPNEISFVRGSEYDDSMVHIMFYALQPSGRALIFVMPHKAEDTFGKEFLPSGKRSSLTVGRYAELMVEEVIKNDKTILIAKNLKLISDTEIESIINAKKGVVV